MLVLLWQENFQSTGRAETSTPKEQCSGWWSGQGEHQPAKLLWSPPSILHDLKCLKIPHHVFECILAIRVISATTCACGISWLVTRFFYLCLEPTVFRLLNKYFGFSGRAEKKKKKVRVFKILIHHFLQRNEGGGERGRNLSLSTAAISWILLLNNFEFNVVFGLREESEICVFVKKNIFILYFGTSGTAS